MNDTAGLFIGIIGYFAILAGGAYLWMQFGIVLGTIMALALWILAPVLWRLLVKHVKENNY
jgi:hypothetical protein